MRIRAIDWARGLVIVLMTVAHAGRFDAAHMHGDTARTWVVGSPLPVGEFLTRWVTHLCAPTFLLLAGVSLALSCEKRRGQPGQTRFIVTRGLLILALDPLWMSLGFGSGGYDRFIFQVLYAIGASMVCMAALRRLSSPVLLAGAVAIQLAGELSARWQPVAQPWQTLWKLLFVGGPVGPAVIAYPLVPWLSFMMAGWVLGRWLLQPAPRMHRARAPFLAGTGLLGLFAIVRGMDGYGNWNLYRDSGALLQWLHVSKYPPSLAFAGLELGLGLWVLGLFMVLDDPARPRRPLAPLSLLGGTAFFYYLIHVHLMKVAGMLLKLDPHTLGLAKTWSAGAVTVLVLLGPCAWFRTYKRAHPDGWTRYI